MELKYIILVLFIVFLIIGIYSAFNVIFTKTPEPENNNWTASGSIVANNSSYVLTDSNRPISTGQYYEVYGPNNVYVGSYPGEYIGGNGSEYYDYSMKFSVNLSDIDWKIELEDPKNTKLNEEIIKQNLTNEIIYAYENGLLSSASIDYNITIKDGIMSGGYNNSSSKPLNNTGDEILNFTVNSKDYSVKHIIRFNVTIPEENIQI